MGKKNFMDIQNLKNKQSQIGDYSIFGKVINKY